MNTSSDYPLVSVVLATYNGERFLEEQLDSILNQTYTNLEVIAVDDCSTDNTLDMLQQYADKDKRLEIIINETNIGYVKNFEKGFKKSKGDFIAPSDQDDVWELNKIELLMRDIDSHEVIYSDSVFINSSGQSLHRKLSDIKTLMSFDNCLAFAISNNPPGHAMIVRRELLNQCYPFPAMIPHDYWLGFVATTRQAIKYVDLPLVNYRQHTGNVFGAVKATEGKRKKIKKDKKKKLVLIRERMNLQYEKCPEGIWQKQVFKQLLESYENFGLYNNLKRMGLFFRYRKYILINKKKSGFRKILFCIKMFFKIK